MTATDSRTTCPICGAGAKGPFCAECGAVLNTSGCTGCGRPVAAGAKFCHHCGTPAGATRAPAPATGKIMLWAVPGLAVLALVAFLIGQRVARGSSGSGTDDRAPLADSPMGPGVSGAGAESGGVPDINSMTPEERANRLFDRVMRYSEEGKPDSARFFAPMAKEAYEMLGPLDAHKRYDIGMIDVVSGDDASARAQADAILKQNPNHLLGLILAARSAGLRKDGAAQANFERRLRSVAATERAKALPEYLDHKPDIDNALKAGSKVP